MKPNRKTKKPVKHILVPVDFSAATSDLIIHARSFADQENAAITLLHVVEPFHADWHMDTTDLQREQRKRAARAMEELITREFPCSPKVRGEIRAGRPVEIITDVARKSRTDIILIATHGRTGIKRAFLGSVAERVVRHAPCAVLVVR